MNGKLVGMVVGFGLGWAMIEFGFVAAVFVAVCALAGWGIGKVVDGEISLYAILDRISPRDRV